MKKILLLLITVTGIVFPRQAPLKTDTLFKSNFQISNQILTRDINGKHYIAFTAQTGTTAASREIFYAVQEQDSFIINQATSNFTEEISSSLLITNDEKLHLIFLSRDSENLMQLYYMNNASGKFSKRIQLTKTPVSKIAPRAVIDRNGIIHIVYFTNNFADNQVCYKSFSTSNFTIGSDFILCNGETDKENDADIITDEKNKVHIAVKAGSINEGRLRYFTNSSGLMKEVPLRVDANINNPRLVFTGRVLNIFYKNNDDQRIYWLKKKRDFGMPEAVTPDIHIPMGFRNCSVDEDDRAYVVYENLEEEDLKGIYLIYLQNEKCSVPIKLGVITDNSVTGDISSCSYKDGLVSFLASSNFRKELNTSSSLIFSRKYIFGNALVKASGDSLNFGKQYTDDNYELSFRIKNEGSTVLKLFAPELPGTAYSIPLFDTLSVLPDSSVSVIVNFNPSDTISYSSTLTLHTNAINTKKIGVILTGKGEGYPEIMTDRDTILVYNTTLFTDSIFVINSGTKVLTIDSVTVSNSDIRLSEISVMLQPGDTVYIPFTLNRNKKSQEQAIDDTITIYSDDPYLDEMYIVLQTMHLTDVEKDSEDESASYQLFQNYPNPFNPSTTISFSISQSAYISLSVYDALAREIAELADGYYAPGQYNIPFTAEDISTGIYYYKLRVKSGEKKAPDYVEVRKMMLIK